MNLDHIFEGQFIVPERQVLESKTPHNHSPYFFSEFFPSVNRNFREKNFVDCYVRRDIVAMYRLVHFLGVCGVSSRGGNVSVVLQAGLGVGQGSPLGAAASSELEIVCEFAGFTGQFFGLTGFI